MSETQEPRKYYKTLLLDMDGVLAEVSKSYRAAIEKTCHSYGATSVTQDTITEWKARGNANDDWKLSHALILNDPNGQADVTLEQVTATFEEYYQGTVTTPGLYTLETLIPTIETLKELRKRCIAAGGVGMGIVTGRPRKDCDTFLQSFNLTSLFDASYCMEDGPSKPDPYPVLKCCELLGVTPSKDVVLVGDTPDDIAAAVAAGCSGIGVTTPEAVAEQESKQQPHDKSPLAIVMKEQRGADCILPPGFADLIHMFPVPGDS